MEKKYFDEFTIDQTRIWCIERGVVGIDKKPSGKTNSACSRKKVKWQKVSRILTKNLGGDWTTRSLPIINGIFEEVFSKKFFFLDPFTRGFRELFFTLKKWARF